MQSPGLSVPPVGFAEVFLSNRHPNDPGRLYTKFSPGCNGPQPKNVHSIETSNTSPPCPPLEIGDILPTTPSPSRGGSRSNCPVEISGGGIATHNAKRFSCQICYRTFVQLRSLMFHKKHHCQNTCPCQHCGRPIRKENLNDHITKYHYALLWKEV